MESGTCGGVPADELEAEVLFGIVEPVAQDQRDVEGDPARLVAVDVGAVDEDEAAVLAGAGGADLVEGHDGIASAGRRVVDEEAQLGRQDRRRPRHLWQVEPETAVAVVVPDAVQVSSWKKNKKKQPFHQPSLDLSDTWWTTRKTDLLNGDFSSKNLSTGGGSFKWCCRKKDFGQIWIGDAFVSVICHRRCLRFIFVVRCYHLLSAVRSQAELVFMANAENLMSIGFVIWMYYN